MTPAEQVAAYRSRHTIRPSWSHPEPGTHAACEVDGIRLYKTPGRVSGRGVWRHDMAEVRRLDRAAMEAESTARIREAIDDSHRSWFSAGTAGPDPLTEVVAAAQAVCDVTHDYDLNEAGQAVMTRLRAALKRVSGEDPGDKPWVHGTRLGREHRSLRTHMHEDHGYSIVGDWSDGALHGEHDKVHGKTWAYAFDLPHEPVPGRPLVCPACGGQFYVHIDHAHDYGHWPFPPQPDTHIAAKHPGIWTECPTCRPAYDRAVSSTHARRFIAAGCCSLAFAHEHDEAGMPVSPLSPDATMAKQLAHPRWRR